MVWDLQPDAIGLDRFKPWDRLKEPSEDTSSIAPVTAFVDELDARDFRDERKGREAGRELPQNPQRRLDRAPGQRVQPAQAKSPQTLRALVRECCLSLRHPVGEADKFVARLHKEWLETPKQLLSLGAEGWARLALPVGLESELHRRLGLAEDKDALKPRKPRPLTPGSPVAPAAPLVTRERGDLQQALRRQCGDAWASHLLSALGLQRRDTVDANSLQSALRVLGVPSFSTSQVQSAVRAAAKGAEARGPPSAEAVIHSGNGANAR